MSPPLRLLLRFAVIMLVLWVMTTYLTQFVQVTGGWKALIIIGSLLTLMDLIVRPILNVITAPFKLFATLITLILLNVAFVWIAAKVVAVMNPSLVTFHIIGAEGWLVVALCFGITHWLTKILFK